jgi:hypothetical protein
MSTSKMNLYIAINHRGRTRVSRVRTQKIIALIRLNCLLRFERMWAILLSIMKGIAINRHMPYRRIGSNGGQVWLNAPPG